MVYKVRSMKKEDHPLGEILAWDPQKGEPRTSFLSVKVPGFSRAWSFNIAKEGKSKKNPNRSGINKVRKEYCDPILGLNTEPGELCLKYHISRPARVTDEGVYEPAWQMYDFRTPVSMVSTLIKALTSGIHEGTKGTLSLDPMGFPGDEAEVALLRPEDLLREAFNYYNSQPGRKAYDPGALLEEEGIDSMREKVLNCAALCKKQKQLWIDKNGFDDVVRNKPSKLGRRFVRKNETAGVDRDTLRDVLMEILKEEGVIQ